MTEDPPAKAMGAEGQVSDAEFRATFSLLPHVLRLSQTLASVSSGQADSQSTHKAVSELQVQLQRCHQLLDTIPALNHTPQEQQAVLERKKEQLKQKCDLLLKYKTLAVLSGSPHR